MMMVWTVVAWLSGSLMFSYWLGLMARQNLKTVGDGNPGAMNLYKAAGIRWGVAGVVLDFMKGYLPVLLLMNHGAVGGYVIVPVAAAPVLGHAFSPFLKFKGGKAIAVTFGVWSALSGFEVSLVYALILALLLVIARLANQGKQSSAESDAFQIVFGMLLVFIYLYVRTFSLEILWCWLAIFVLLVYTHRHELLAFLEKIFKKSDKPKRFSL
jgi:acyl phosphate:glycerol-3-phosphate acyltransferase